MNDLIQPIDAAYFESVYFLFTAVISVVVSFVGAWWTE